MKDEICSFDARKITPDIRASVEELLVKNANSFDPKVSLMFIVISLLLIPKQSIFFFDNSFKRDRHHSNGLSW